MKRKILSGKDKDFTFIPVPNFWFRPYPAFLIERK